MKILELFAGSCSFSKVAYDRGHEVFTSDIKPDLPGIDYVCDILDFEPSRVPFVPDLLWASPDCATWSKASGNIYYNTRSIVPKNDKARQAARTIDKTFEIINYYLSLNPSMIYYVENPEGRLRTYLEVMGITVPVIYTLDQCQYGREYKKPTVIFTNDIHFVPRRRCPGKAICGHRDNLENCGSGKKRGQNLPHGYYKRAMIAPNLCKAILLSAETKGLKHETTNDLATQLSLF